jgi:hypothetical protein
MSLLRVRKLLIAMGNLIGSGFAVGLSSLTNFEFKPDKPFRACLICGDVYQTEADRDNNPLGAIRRQAWADRHAQTHTDREHRMLMLSGNTMTPEAANKLAAYGVIPIADMVLSNEHEMALFESKAIPVNDAEGR